MIRNRVGFTSIELKPSKTPNKNIVVSENNKSESVIKEEIDKDIADFDLSKKIKPDFLFKDLNFDDKKSLKSLNNFIDNHKDSKLDKNIYVKGLNNTSSGIELLKNKDVIDNYLKNNLGINLKDFLLLNYKIDTIESKDLSKAFKDKLKYGINNSSKSIKSSNIDSKNDIISVLDNALKLIDKNKYNLDNFNKLNKKLSVNTSIELNSDKQGIFLNVSNNSEFLKKLDFIKSKIKNLPVSVTPSVNFNMGYRQKVLDIKK